MCSGLSSYATRPLSGAQSLRELITFATKHVPEAWHAVTPIHVQATAGLRSLPAEQSSAILEAVRNELSDVRTNPFQFRRSWARMITGTQEGLNGWIATNYLAGVLHLPASPEPVPTFGLIEMGGFSMQVTFVPADTSKVDPKHLIKV